MSNCTRCLGLDVHAETITAAIAEGRGKIRSIGKFPNPPEAVRKLIEKLGGAKSLKVCYEAGPTGYAASDSFKARDNSSISPLASSLDQMPRCRYG